MPSANRAERHLPEVAERNWRFYKLMFWMYAGVSLLTCVGVFIFLQFVDFDAQVGFLIAACIASWLIHIYFIFFRCPRCRGFFHGSKYFLFVGSCVNCNLRRFDNRFRLASELARLSNIHNTEPAATAPSLPTPPDPDPDS
jgi:hypothetical protein